MGEIHYELPNHLGNVLNVITDRKIAIPTADLTKVDHYTAQVVSYSDYYPFGMQMPGRHGQQNYDYGFNGMRIDDEIKGEFNSYDFGARIYDPRIGRWLSRDALAGKYPNISSYVFVNNMPIIAIDPDGNDIIILSAPAGANGAGHAAILVGNDTDGWNYFSKNGTGHGANNSFGSKGPSLNQNDGNHFKSLKEFANSSSNFQSGEVVYTSAFRITSSVDNDKKIEASALAQVKKDYKLIGASCIDVCSDGLKAGGFDPGWHEKTVTNDYSGYSTQIKLLNSLPNGRYEDIVKNNKGEDISSQIIPDISVVKAEKENAYPTLKKVYKNRTNDSDNTNVNTMPIPDFEKLSEATKTLKLARPNIKSKN